MISNIRMEIMPEDMYVRQNLRSRDIREGDIVPVVVSGYNYEEQKVCCEISSHLRKAFIRLENFMFPELSSDFDREHIPPAIKKHIGRQVVATVISKGTKGDFELSRKALLEDTTNDLVSRVGDVVTATVTGFGPHEAFIDIGNGIITRLNKIEASINKCRSLADLFTVGSQIRVKLMSFDSNTKRFEVSRKDAYEQIIFSYGSTKSVMVFGPVPAGGGVFVEYDPGNVGIMDIPPEVNAAEIYGKHAFCFIKSINEKGFKADFIGIIDETPQG